jgi:hypothetical protein
VAKPLLAVSPEQVVQAALHLVSRDWRFLEERKLIARERAARRTRIWLLADDGGGEPYVHPGAGRLGKRLDDGALGYFQLPYASGGIGGTRTATCRRRPCC